MCATVLYANAEALPVFSEVMVQSRTSPGLTAAAFSNGTIFESRSTAAESSTFTSGRGDAIIKCLCASPATPTAKRKNVATRAAVIFFFDVIIVNELLRKFE